MSERRMILVGPGNLSLSDTKDAEIARLKAELADRDRRIAEIAVNCPSCGRHDFGLLSGPIEENERLKKELAEAKATIHTLQCEYLRQNPFEDPQDTIDELTRELAALRRKVGEWADRIIKFPPSWQLESIADAMREEAGK